MNFQTKEGPYIKSNDDTKKIMTRLLIALAPIVAFGIFKNTVLVYYYTNASILSILNPIFMILVGIVTSIFSEFLYIKFILKKNYNYSLKLLFKSYSIIPGLFLAIILPVNTPLWIVAFGAFCATILGKMIYGGLGQNIFNPALVGYLIIGASYSSKLGSFLNQYELDTIGGATPLANLASLNYIGTYDNIVGNYGSLFNFLSGTIPGVIGEVSKILIILAFIFLAVTKTIKWRIPVMYVSTVFILSLLIGTYFDMGLWYPLFNILSGGLLFGAVFMSTDPVTSPITNNGQIFYGICLGILTILIRFLTPFPEGVMTSILFMNMLVFLFDKMGLKIKDNSKKLIMPIIIISLIFVSSYYLIVNKLNGNIKFEKVNIINIDESNNNKIYTVISKGWGLITAEVTVSDNKIVSIDIVSRESETKWSLIENNDYINSLIINQDNIENLDTIGGCTYTSNALKSIVEEVMNKELENEE